MHSTQKNKKLNERRRKIQRVQHLKQKSRRLGRKVLFYRISSWLHETFICDISLFQIDALKQKMNEIKLVCSRADEQALKKACDKLPESQQAAVQACFDVSKKNDSRGNRYTNQWIYECLLLRIKSRKTYSHLRTHKILALPCLETLSRYIKSIKGTYGFDDKTFCLLKKKTANMAPTDIRGEYKIIFLLCIRKLVYVIHVRVNDFHKSTVFILVRKFH